MPPPLTPTELTRRALAAFAAARASQREIETLGRTGPRTTRLRAANGRGGRYLKRAVRCGLSDDEARQLYEREAAHDPEYGAPEWA